MDMLKLVGYAAGILGVILCLGAGLLRLSGTYYLGGLEMMTVFNAGIGVMVFSCLVKLEIISRK